MTNAFDLLNRDMKKFVYENGWQSLTKIQEAAIKQIYKTDNNLSLIHI